MTILFENGKELRKELTHAIGEILAVKPEYQGPPSFAYKVGDYTVNRDGEVETDEFTDTKAVGQLVVGLRAKGFATTGNDWEIPAEPPQDEFMSRCIQNKGIDGVSLLFPKEGMTGNDLGNLSKLIEGKGNLIKLALDTETLDCDFTDDEVLRFDWLAGTSSPDLINATIHLIAALIKMAKTQKRVSMTWKSTENPKYTFRCFLLRLGFIGEEYKDVRKVLMAGIPGIGSRKAPKPQESTDTDA